MKTFVYVKKKAATNELKHEEIESRDTCESVGVIASSSWVEVIIWLRHCATDRKVADSIPDGVIGIFLLAQSFRPHCGPGVDSACNRNECKEYFLGVRRPICRADNLTTFMC